MMIYIAIYIVISALVLGFLTKFNLKDWLFKMTLVSFLPVIGWFIPSVWPKQLIRHDEQAFERHMQQQTDDIQLELLQANQKIERKHELDIVSIEEALIINDFSTRRRILIDVLKQDAFKYLEVLKTAVTNEDTETSHYAVTAIIEVKRELTILLQKLSVEFTQNPQDNGIALAYADVIKEYLRSGFLDKQQMKQYQITYTQVLQQIIDNGKATEETYLDKINMELTLHNIIAAEENVRAFKEHYPQNEQAYLCMMAIYYKTRSFDKLAQELQNLKNSSIVLSNHALTIVRYWSAVGRESIHEMARK